MKKIIPTTQEVEEIIRLYNEESLGSYTISKIINYNKPIIIKVLKENNVTLRKSGRQNIGGKKDADKRYREKNKEKLYEKYKNWYEQNTEHRKRYMEDYLKNNIEKIRETKRKYEKTRKQTDPLYKLISNFRTAIYTVLKENNVNKYGHYFEVLKYTPEELINHLEKQFIDGMTWDNYGEWHVDHILPITSFDFKEIGDEEFMKCWSLENLQPMWGSENIRKSNKIL